MNVPPKTAPLLPTSTKKIPLEKQLRLDLPQEDSRGFYCDRGTEMVRPD
ncbi:hypothetical protein CA54_54440 [Symmachiella macrocystis]|uniref:Uncharacterized protein n=1 Tax=Symmachiella macrocystis TaxID=2527985 RepID=A0A5C6B6S8_9PLAN|nr:hypothetical protein CA54_54440 [Symmachiella macrocystis]